ncbi:hypothetical protein ACLB2K_055318 [Fragaria x ananassa]
MAWYHEFTTANSTSIQKQKTISRPRWSPPIRGTFKLNVDGAFLHNGTDGGIGGIVRDSQGSAIACFAHHISYVNSPKQVELEAIKTALQWLLQLGYHQCEVQPDCESAVADIHAPDYLQLEYGNILADIQHSFDSLQHAQVTYAPRTINIVLHKLASLAFEGSEQLEWLDSIPLLLRDTLSYDCNL